MTFYISPFVLGIICTIGAEILAFILTCIFVGVISSVKTRRNASK